MGNVGLLRGNQYLAAASRILNRRRVACEVRVVGPYPPGLIDRPEFRGPTYVGQVPRSGILGEFLCADIFVLPTLCDSFALAHLEALASGLPVITTTNCGSVVRDGVDGFIVPIRDPDVLADRIERLVSDRPLWAWMLRNVRARVGEFNRAQYGERLVGAVTHLQPPEAR